MEKTAVSTPQQTSLYNHHLKSNGKMVDFAGWQMPIHYGSQIEEHNIVRNDVGMFDVSHMAVIDITGNDAKKFLQFTSANDIARCKEPGKALYGCMLNKQAGIIDDLIAYFISETYYRIVVNAGCFIKDFEWLNNAAKDFSVQIIYRSDLSIIAVQGPSALITVTKSLTDYPYNEIDNLKSFEFIQNKDIFVARTGYTGEKGIEIILPHQEAVIVWEKLISAGVNPIGLGARDTLRLEAGLNLYGLDMDETTTPFESNLGWTVSLSDERDFIGKYALLEQKKFGISKKLIGIVLEDKGILRSNQKVYVNDNMVGVVTSGTFSPTLKQSIAFARVSEIADDYLVEIRNKKHRARKCSIPFVKNSKQNF